MGKKLKKEKRETERSNSHEGPRDALCLSESRKMASISEEKGLYSKKEGGRQNTWNTSTTKLEVGRQAARKNKHKGGKKAGKIEQTKSEEKVSSQRKRVIDGEVQTMTTGERRKNAIRSGGGH